MERLLAGLVHESARSDATESARHRRFIASRLTMGVIALACLPVYVALRGAPDVLEFVLFACLIGPLFAALALAQTGSLTFAHGISATSFAGFIVCVAGATGGVSSAATIWLVAVPLEALLSGSRRSAVVATVVATVATVVIALLDLTGALATSDAVPPFFASTVFALFAIAHAGALAVAVSRAEDVSRNARRRRDSENRCLFQAVDDLVTWHDVNGHIVSASAGSMKLLGVPSSALEGRGLLARVHIQDRPAYLKGVSDAAVGGQAVRVQFRVHYGDALRGDSGRVIWVEMRASRLDGPGHEASGVIAVTRDITLQKRHEEDLELARIKAENADALKGRFLATVSHELRTPLNAIIGFSEILSSETMNYIDADQRRDYARIIHESGHHLLDVVNSLLDISKIESGNFDFSPAHFDARALVNGCIDLMRLKADSLGVALQADIPAEALGLVGDQRACRQIVINLLSNAIKFTPAGGSVMVTMRGDRQRVILSISDTGVGVGEEDLDKLGNPFFQARSTYDRQHEGTGLGLSVVRGLVGLHGGSLTIESAKGEGTLVTVELPLDCTIIRDEEPRAPIPIRTATRRVSRPVKDEVDKEYKRSA